MKTKDQALFGHLLWVEPRSVAHAAGKALTFLGTQHQLHLLLNMIRYDWSSCNCKEVSWPRVLKHSQEEDENRRCWTPRLPRDASHTFNIFYYKVFRGGSKNYSRINRVWLCKERRQAVDFWKKRMKSSKDTSKCPTTTDSPIRCACRSSDMSMS